MPSNVFDQPFSGSDAPRLLASLLVPGYPDLTACFCYLKPIIQDSPGLTSCYKIGLIMVPALLRHVWLLFLSMASALLRLIWLRFLPCDKTLSRSNFRGERFLMALGSKEIRATMAGGASRAVVAPRHGSKWCGLLLCREQSCVTTKCNQAGPTPEGSVAFKITPQAGDQVLKT